MSNDTVDFEWRCRKKFILLWVGSASNVVHPGGSQVNGLRHAYVATNMSMDNLITKRVISGFAWSPKVQSQPVINIRLWKRLSAQ